MDVRTTLRDQADLVLGAALGGVYAVEAAAYGAGMLTVLASLLAGLCLALRRRTPVPAFLLALLALSATLWLSPGLDEGAVAFVVIYLVAHYSVGRWSEGTEALLAAGCVLLSMVAFGIGDARANDVPVSEVSLGSVAFTVIFVGGPWAAGLAMRLRRERESLLTSENQRLVDEQAARAARAVAEERARIARELHDVVSHAISVTVLQARGARRTLDVDPEAARTALHAIEQTNTAALGDMRRLLAVLRDTEPAPGPDLVPQPSLTHLPDLVSHVREAGVQVSLEVTGDATEVPPGVDLSAYRIVQEALTNVVKHAGEASAHVRLDYDADALVVSVTDDGRSAADAVQAGHGLIGIRERVAVVGGQVEAGPAPGGGFSVRARLPFSVEVS